MNCLLCGQTLWSPTERNYYDTRFGHRGLYAVVGCANCGLEQTLPRPDPVTLKQLYETFYNFGGEKSTRYSHWRQRFLNSSFYQIWLMIDGDVSFHSRKGHGRLLDYGCNEGRGLTIYHHRGYEVEGLELNTHAADLARAKGFAVTSSALEEFEPTQSFDIVILANVLEHALDPREMLRQVARLLKESGEVWISCPNSRSAMRYLFGRYWINWHVPFHITHFTAVSLTRLLKEQGFSVVESGQVTPALWVAQSFLSRLFARQGQPTRQMRSAILVAGLIVLLRAMFFPLLWLCNRAGAGDCLVMRAAKTTSS